MARKVMTLDKLLKNIPDGELLDIELELQSTVVPDDGYAQRFRRKINKMIDRGELCICTDTYRRLYLPTLEKLVNKEMARRYTQALLNGVAEPDTSYEYEQLRLEGI